MTTSAAPLPKLAAAAAAIVLIVSLDRHDWRGSLVFALLPYLTAAALRLPLKPLFRRMAAALPFVLCAGLAGCFFDRTDVPIGFGWSVPGGVVTLIVLTAKTAGAVSTALLLAATTPVNELAGALAALRVPGPLILQLQLTARYLSVAGSEARSMHTAYRLRRPAGRAIPVRDWGMLAGRLFLRGADRAERIYRAMRCRLFDAAAPTAPCRRATPREWTAGVAAVLALAGLRWLL